MCHWGTCVGDMNLPLREGASLEVGDHLVSACDHHQKRQMRVAWRSGVPGTWAPGVHANCIHNEIAALGLRSLGPTPLPELSVGDAINPVSRAFKRLRSLAHSYRGSRWTYLETALSYKGGLRRRYLEAARSLIEVEFCSRDAILDAFLKAEKLPVGKFAKPRMIFPRSPRYNLHLASWLKPFEHWLWARLTARRLFGGSNTRVVAKGLSPRQRANLIVRKFKSFEDCVVFEVDGKAFEAHVTSDQLKEEHRVYAAAYHSSGGLRDVLKYQLSLVGTTANGVSFSREGCRASGDFNTGMGNTIVMLCVLVGCLAGRGFGFDLLADGDNSLVFCSRRDLARVLDGFSDRVLRLSGHEMTLEEPVSCLEAIRFGQSAPIYLGHRLGWTMVRDYRKVLSGACASHRWLREPSFGRRWVNGVARCELSLARGVPVLQTAFLGLFNATVSGKKVVHETSLRDYYVMGAWLATVEDVVEVDWEARVSFSRAFGLAPDDQLLIEGSMEFEVGHADSGVGFFYLRDLWSADPGLLEVYLDAFI